jgi:hypothetical protein
VRAEQSFAKQSVQRSLATKSCTESVRFTKFCTENHCTGAGKEQRPATKTGSKVAAALKYRRPTPDYDFIKPVSTDMPQLRAVCTDLYGGQS